VEIVPATTRDYPALVELYDRYAFALRRREWLDWKYTRGPYGRTLTFLVRQDGRLVGAASLLPRVWHYGGRRLVGLQFVDGLLGAEVRGQRVFRDLTAFLLRQPPASGEVVEAYFYLTVSSVAASVKACANAGLHPLGRFALFTRVIDPGALARVPRLAWLTPLARLVRPLADAVSLGGLGRGITVEEIRRFDRDLTWLFAPGTVHGDRSVEFLNWRVFENPQARLRAFLLHERGELAGYIILKEAGESLEIMDLKFVAPRARYLAAFLRHVAVQRLAASVDCSLLPGHPYRRLLRRVGFLPRGARGVFYVHRLAEAGLPADVAAWDINYLDSDW